MEREDNVMVINAFLPTKIPVLIRSGEPIDRHSMFFLALVAFQLDVIPYFERWLRCAADLGDAHAQQLLGRYLLSQDSLNESMFWLTRSALEWHDPKSIWALGCKLWTTLGKLDLAENLLVAVAREGDQDGITELGKIYVRDKALKRKGLALLKCAAGMGNDIARKELAENSSLGLVGWLVVSAAVGAGIWSGYVFVRYLRRRWRSPSPTTS
jgi:hypothetical protein